MGQCTLEDDAHQVYAVHVYVYHSHTETTLITEDNRAPFHSPIDCFKTPVLEGVAFFRQCIYSEKVNNACYIAQVVNPVVLPFL